MLVVALMSNQRRNTMFKVKGTLVAIAFAMSAGLAHATPVVAPAAPLFQGMLTLPTDDFGFTTRKKGLFDVYWTFNLPLASLVGSSITNIELIIRGLVFNEINDFAANIDGSAFTRYSIPIPGGNVQTLAFLGKIGAGDNHILEVTGTAGNGGASFGGNFVAVPVNKVPEPGTLSLIGAGLIAAFAFLGIRRKKSAPSGGLQIAWSNWLNWQI